MRAIYSISITFWHPFELVVNVNWFALKELLCFWGFQGFQVKFRELVHFTHLMLLDSTYAVFKISENVYLFTPSRSGSPFDIILIAIKQMFAVSKTIPNSICLQFKFAINQNHFLNKRTQKCLWGKTLYNSQPHIFSRSLPSCPA